MNSITSITSGPRRVLAVPAALLGGALLLSACGSTSSSSAAAGDHSGHGATSSATSPATSATSSATAGSSSTSSAGSNSSFNEADAMFATMMIPHHAQALEMAKLAPTRAGSAQVKDLAAKIEAAQQPEIDTMSGWLKAWGKPVPDTSMAGMAGMDHGSMGHSMAGMMTDAEMKQLESAKGMTFDKLFLTMMIKHHEGAITMAQDQVKNGQNPDAVALAKKIAADQTAEIATMKTLLQPS